MFARERDARFGDLYRRLWSRRQSTPTVACKLGCEPRQRRSTKCSACKFKSELDIDRALGGLISGGTIAESALCPYQLANLQLIRGLELGPGAEISVREEEVRRIEHLTHALKHIAHAVGTVVPTRDELTQFQHEDPYYAQMVAVMDAQASIAEALKYFKVRYDEHERLRTTQASSPGKRGNVDFHGIAASLVDMWEFLVGAPPNKKNEKFHDLLQGAWTTVFGSNKRAPNWEGQTAVARRLAMRRANPRRTADCRRTSRRGHSTRNSRTGFE